MGTPRRIRSIVTGWPELTAVLREWRDAIVRESSWSWGPGFHVHDGEHGRTVSLVQQPVGARWAVVGSAGITAAPNANTLGQGTVMLRTRNGAALANDRNETCYSNFTVAAPPGRRCLVVWEDGAWALAGLDCPP